MVGLIPDSSPTDERIPALPPSPSLMAQLLRFRLAFGISSLVLGVILLFLLYCKLASTAGELSTGSGTDLEAVASLGSPESSEVAPASRR